MRQIVKLTIAGWLVCVASGSTVAVAAVRYQQDQSAPALQEAKAADPERARAQIAQQVRHELLLMPWYSVFDWIEGEVLADGAVVLRGEVTRPTTRSDAERRVNKLESVSKVVNEIEILPLSPDDDSIRIAMYRTMFNFNGPLFQYAMRSMPPIHIVVKNARATLKGSVRSEMDKQLAYTAARSVPGVLEVINELKVERDV